jgi:hypothetical protein
LSHPLSPDLREMAVAYRQKGFRAGARGIEEAADHLDTQQRQIDIVTEKWMCTHLDWNTAKDELTATKERLEKLEKTVRSLLSEEGVREELSCYVMGIELINMVEGDKP